VSIELYGSTFSLYNFMYEMKKSSN